MRNKPRIRFKGFTEDWEQRKLISLYKTIRNAFVGTATPYYTNDSINGYFYLESNNVKNGKINRNNEIYITKDFYQKQEDKLLYKDDIVIVQSGHVGHTAVIPEELDKTAAHALIMLQNKKENFDSHFINNSFQTPLIRNKIDEITIGNTIKHILASDVKNIVINMPSFKEQKLISQLFKLFDLNITLHQRKLEKLKLAKKALLQKLFPKNGSKFPELRFKGVADAWEQRKLGEFADITKLAGFEFTKYIVYSDKGNIIALRGLNIKDGDLNLEDVKYIDSSDFTKLKRSKLFRNDILFTYVGTIGEVARIQEDDKYYLAPNVSRIRIKNRLLSEFLMYYMDRDLFYQKIIFPLIATSSQPALSMANIREFNITYPRDINEQQKIALVFSLISHHITLHQRKLDKLQEVKKGLLQKMFV